MGGRRLAFAITLLLGELFSPSAAEAQQAAKVARMGYLVPNPAAATPLREAFLQGLRDPGYVEAHNLVIDYRYAEGRFERLPALAAELVALKVDVIFAGDLALRGPAAEGGVGRRDPHCNICLTAALRSPCSPADVCDGDQR